MKGIKKLIGVGVLVGALVGYCVHEGIDYLRRISHTNENQIMMYAPYYFGFPPTGEGELVTLDFKVEDLTLINKLEDDEYKRVFFKGPDDLYLIVIDSGTDRFFNRFDDMAYCPGGSGDRDGCIDIVCFTKEKGDKIIGRILDEDDLPGNLAKEFTKAYLNAMRQNK